MNCKHVQEIILTDYSDGELSKTRLREIDTHLMSCLSCRLLAQKVRLSALEPFKGENVHRGPDEFVWSQIKRRIQEEQPAVVRPMSFVFRPVLVAASLCLMLGVGIITYKIQHLEPQPYLANLISTDTQDNDSVDAKIETYFL